MSHPIVECVPNISEGRNREVIDACAAAAASVKGVALLDIDAGYDTNRTVITFAGSPEAVLEGAFRLISESYKRIDMAQHHGEHPRSGATDVCPFVPVANITMEECAELARKLGERVGQELQLPVYLYEFAASSPERRNLAVLRQGEYEALPQKMQDPAWKPDFGPQSFNSRFGLVHIGARKFLGAYNINLNTRSKKLANDIALSLREKGRAARNAQGEILRDEQGKALQVPGIFKNCKAAAWYLDKIQQCQITMNLTDLDVTSLHHVFDKTCEMAAERGMRVTGSELIGLIPLAPMLEAGRYFLKKQKRSTAVSEKELVRVAIESLGLDDVAPFDPQKKIVEYALQAKAPLVQLNLADFADELASESPAPGGGSVSALCGSLAAALTAMVGNLTYGKKGYETAYDQVEAIAQKAQNFKARFLAAIDEDTCAFNEVMAASHMRKETDFEKQSRAQALEKANRHAVQVPAHVAELASHTFELIAQMVELGNRNSISDVGVAAYCAYTAVRGAALNVRINLPSIQDETFTNNIQAQLDVCLQNAQRQLTIIESRLEQLL